MKPQPTLQSDEVGVSVVPDGGDECGEGDEVGEVLVQHSNVVWAHHATVMVKDWQTCMDKEGWEENMTFSLLNVGVPSTHTWTGLLAFCSCQTVRLKLNLMSVYMICSEQDRP